MKKENDNSSVKLGFKVVRNIFFVYLFTSMASDRYEIFSAICASFPFIFPVIFDSDTKSIAEKIIRSLLCGGLGILAAVLFMLVTKSYSTVNWLIPATYSFSMCVCYLFIQCGLSEHKRTVMKCIISVSVCFLAFV